MVTGKNFEQRKPQAVPVAPPPEKVKSTKKARDVTRRLLDYRISLPTKAETVFAGMLLVILMLLSLLVSFVIKDTSQSNLAIVGIDDSLSQVSESVTLAQAALLGEVAKNAELTDKTALAQSKLTDSQQLLAVAQAEVANLKASNQQLDEQRIAEVVNYKTALQNAVNAQADAEQRYTRSLQSVVEAQKVITGQQEDYDALRNKLYGLHDRKDDTIADFLEDGVISTADWTAFCKVLDKWWSVEME